LVAGARVDPWGLALAVLSRGVGFRRAGFRGVRLGRGGGRSVCFGGLSRRLRSDYTGIGWLGLSSPRHEHSHGQQEADR